MSTTTKLSKRERLAAALGVDPDRYSFDDLRRHVAEYVDETRQLEGVVEAALEALPGDLNRYDELVGGIRHLAAYGATWAEHSLRVHRTLDLEHGPDRSGREWECAAERVEYVIGQLVQEKEQLREELNDANGKASYIGGVLDLAATQLASALGLESEPFTHCLGDLIEQVREERAAEATHFRIRIVDGKVVEHEEVDRMEIYRTAARAHARARELEAEVEQLREDLDVATRFGDAQFERAESAVAGAEWAYRNGAELTAEVERLRALVEQVEAERARFERHYSYERRADEREFRGLSAEIRELEAKLAGESAVLDIEELGGPKALRETMCVAQGAVLREGRGCAGSRDHAMRLQRIADVCDQHRPLGYDGTHASARCTPTCGCEDGESQFALAT